MKSYTIQPDTHYGIYVGRDKVNRQIFAGISDNLLIIVLFDKDGNFLEVLTKLRLSVYTAMATETLLNWLDELGYKMSSISVKQFFYPNTKSALKIFQMI